MQRKVGRLVEHYKQVASQYRVDVKAGEKGEAAWGRMCCAPATRSGMRSGSRAYWDLTEVEATFRALKSELGLRPIWHRLDRRVSAHMLVSVLAFHAVHLIRTRLKARRLSLCWQSIRDRLATWVRITTSVREVGGSLISMR